MSTDQPYDLGPLITGDHHYALLEHVAKMVTDGFALEFGVGAGTSTRLLAEHMSVVGFDSFQGLPEDWREGYPKGSFSSDFEEVVDTMPENVLLCPGLFVDTLVDWSRHPETWKPVGLVHIDCDLYSSTKTVLDNFGDKIQADKPAIVFDEWFGYPDADQFEQRAWREFTYGRDISWRVLGHGHHEAWGIQIV